MRIIGRGQAVGAVGAGAPEPDLTWLKDWSLQKLQSLGPGRLQERTVGLSIMCSLDLPPRNTPGVGWLSLTWAEAGALLCGALGPLLGGAGYHRRPFLGLFFLILPLVFGGIPWLL